MIAAAAIIVGVFDPLHIARFELDGLGPGWVPLNDDLVGALLRRAFGHLSQQKGEDNKWRHAWSHVLVISSEVEKSLTFRCWRQIGMWRDDQSEK